MTVQELGFQLRQWDRLEKLSHGAIHQLRIFRVVQPSDFDLAPAARSLVFVEKAGMDLIPDENFDIIDFS